ncbi:hypothetical protein HNR21_001914 [Actinomadura cellulosilytica]|uniref:Uncharacterized protein n=1 Tax=Thermomonospora cellulosilytica TaxID=1411118 RepID=A0A7W3R7U4_9ACTN|nr:hypothetical protein [Thermomonospora cellulosilytica]
MPSPGDPPPRRTNPGRPCGQDDFLARLRREFPHWAILPGTLRTPWTAVRGRHLELTAADGISLREKPLAATARDRRPN